MGQPSNHAGKHDKHDKHGKHGKHVKYVKIRTDRHDRDHHKSKKVHYHKSTKIHISKKDHKYYRLNKSCVNSTFDYCTKKVVFKPVLIGRFTLTGSTTTTGATTGTNGVTTGVTTGTTTPGTAQWCSPGFWKNHLADWGPTGISPDDLYSAFFGSAPERTPLGISQGAPTDPTLFTVVDNPQWYGGDAANNVADLLSANHPDINYEGVRVDNCPL
ncbi:hypothetical protein AQ490_07720 [Wenjunlia vitaminophila]|uniref:Uncharacterized protein n=2 Tax=Wenjunlia vitaminophila TaxID=76728 RepID=A0A0T6LN65_WENVI|nr:hypothetical protein AQ490_07720 [Wenjunlia vitaminophila]